ncbi:MAG: lipopolysaccharide biosynthesis protein [Propionibacteriales bacterium]|nr:lipopolysaccharide biosynthesis protein [Propionibacteriales bacterium]
MPTAKNQATARPSLHGALAWFVASYGVAIVGYLALNAVASRFLGRSSFGYFVVVITLTTVIGELALLGVHRAGLREAARLDMDAHDQLARLRLGVRAVCLVSLPAAGVVSAAVTWGLLHGHDEQQRWELAIGVGALVMLSGHQKLWANYLRGFGQVKFASLLEGRSGGALVAVLQSGFLAAVWLILPGLGLTGALGAVALGYLIPVVAAYRGVSRHWHHAPARASLGRDLRGVLGRDWRFASGQLASYLNANLELWMAGLLLTAVDTSLFGAAQRLSLLLVTPLTSLQVVFSPAIARLGHDKDPRQLEALVRTGATLAAIPMLCVCVPILVAPGAVLGIVFGSGYAGAASVLVLLTAGSVVNVLTGLCGATLSMTHREGVVAVVQWAGLGVRLLLGATAAIVLGVDGLGASAGLVTAGIWVALWTAARRRVGVRTHLTLHPKVSVLRNTVS